MEPPCAPCASAACPGAVQSVVSLNAFLVAFHSDSACNVFELDSLRVAYRTSQAETHGTDVLGSAVLTVGSEGSARLLTAPGGTLDLEELHLHGVERSKAVAMGPHGKAFASPSTG